MINSDAANGVALTTTLSPIEIGGTTWGGDDIEIEFPFFGSIDEVKLWTRTLAVNKQIKE
jgi:hypothetical protein